jgi:hypothetical protein
MSRQVIGCPEAMLISIAIIHTSIALHSGLGILPRGVPRGSFANIHSVHLMSRQVIGCPEAMLISIAIIHTSIASGPGLLFCPVACPEPIFAIIHMCT